VQIVFVYDQFHGIFLETREPFFVKFVIYKRRDTKEDPRPSFAVINLREGNKIDFE
jgi:hypothetical protein